MNWYANTDIERGYSECMECRDCVHIHQAGYECDMHICAICGMFVADREEFFKFQTVVEILDK